MKNESDIIVIGAGIAGTSAAAALSDNAKVTVLDQEAHAGFHSTGRSAATWAPYYGPEVIQQLTGLSKPTLSNPADAYGGQPFTGARGEMMLGREGDEEEIERHKAFGMLPLTLAEARELVPLLKESVASIIYTDNMLSIDVDALHQAYIRKIKTSGSQVICDQKVVSLEYTNNSWNVSTTNSQYSAPIVVNAAGAWADNIAVAAGAKPIGLQPKRRSAALAPYADNANMAEWPMIFGAGESFYCTPFGNGLMISPADETNVDPHDAWPEDIDIATGIDMFQQFIDHEVETISHQWAGLRSFAPDGKPVLGFDNKLPGFFWLAGQGGYGIQTSPAMGALCRALIMPENTPDEPLASISGNDIQALVKSMSPIRFQE